MNFSLGKVNANQMFKYYQDEMERKEPFNDDIVNFKAKEDIGRLIGNVCKGLEIIDGFKFIGVDVLPPSKIYIPGEQHTLRGKPVKTIFPIEENRYLEVRISYKLTEHIDPTRDSLKHFKMPKISFSNGNKKYLSYTNISLENSDNLAVSVEKIKSRGPKHHFKIKFHKKHALLSKTGIKKLGIKFRDKIKESIISKLVDKDGMVTNSEVHHHTLYYPELIDGQFFVLNSNRFFPVSQLVDAEFYRSGGNKSAVLKTIFMPLILMGDKGRLADVYGELGKNGIKTRNIKVKLFSKEIPVFNYFFAKYGITDTIKFFGLEKLCRFVERDKNKDDTDKNLYFKAVKNIDFEVNKEWFNSNYKTNSLIVRAFLACFQHSKITYASFYDRDFWFDRLGGFFATNKSAARNKAESVILSLERLLNNTTRDILRIPSEDKEDVYCIMRFMIRNFTKIIRIDNQDLSNKRIRVGEYLIDNFTKKLSRAVVRLVNTKKTTIDQLETIFSNIKSDYILKRVSTIDLIRYNNNTSTLDLFTSALKASKKGPQSQQSGGGISITSKGINPSYLGRLDTISTSSNDPGISVTLIPFFQPKDPNHNHNFFFTDKPEIETMPDDDNDIDDQNSISEEEYAIKQMQDIVSDD